MYSTIQLTLEHIRERERLSDFTKNNLQTAQEWTKSHIGLALDHRRLIRPGKKIPAEFFAIRQVYFTKSCQQIWVRVNQPFISFIHHIWGETVLWRTVFIIQTSDNRMQYFTILRYKLLFRAIEARVILGDPGAVNRVNKMFVVKVFCKIETRGSSRSYRKLSPRTFYRPDYLPLGLRGWARVGFSRKPLKKFSKSSIGPAGSDFYSASSGECLNEH